jgi:hypothetical protein
LPTSSAPPRNMKLRDIGLVSQGAVFNKCGEPVDRLTG